MPHRGTWIDTPYFLSIPFFIIESDSYGFLPRETAEYLAQFLPIEILEMDSALDAASFVACDERRR